MVLYYQVKFSTKCTELHITTDPYNFTNKAILVTQVFTASISAWFIMLSSTVNDDVFK